VERYKVVEARLSALQQISGTTGLVDALFPDGVQELRLLRDSVAAMNDEMLPSDVLERLRNLITQPEMPEKANFVRIMSLQKSKGLTSKVVIVLGCVAGLIPFVDSKETPEEQAKILCEQRRLFYVAMTRPTQILVLSSFATIDRHFAYKIGATTRVGLTPEARTIASPFLGELGATTPAAKIGDEWEAHGYA
jgi:DNA helicase-2/ATP-dependent DNA helicase PcrA